MRQSSPQRSRTPRRIARSRRRSPRCRSRRRRRSSSNSRASCPRLRSVRRRGARVRRRGVSGRWRGGRRPRRRPASARRASLGQGSESPGRLSSRARATASGVVAGPRSMPMVDCAAIPVDPAGGLSSATGRPRAPAGGARVPDCRFDLRPIAHNAGILEEAFDVCCIKTRNGIGVEIRERSAESVALGKNGPPGQPCLERLEAQEFEERTLIGRRKAPLGVVIPLIERITVAETPPGNPLRSSGTAPAPHLPVACRRASPRKRGCRRRPSFVHSAKPICATNSGRVQCVPARDGLGVHERCPGRLQGPQLRAEIAEPGRGDSRCRPFRRTGSSAIFFVNPSEQRTEISPAVPVGSVYPPMMNSSLPKRT